MKLARGTCEVLMLGVGLVAISACQTPGADETTNDIALVSAGLGSVSTANAYADQCVAAQVPLPVSWSNATMGSGDNKWGQDFPFDDGFTQNGDFYIFVMESSNPPGICAANVSGDGTFSVICYGSNTGKACFWEANTNYWPQINQFPPPPNITDQAVVIARSTFPTAMDPATPQCTSCHAGENAFITHMNLDHPTNKHLVPGWMPTDGNHWMQPIVPANWPQNPGPGAASDYPTQCNACHRAPSGPPSDAVAGRFPTLRTAAFSTDEGAAFCEILAEVVNRPALTGGMPPGNNQCTTDVDCALQTDPQVAAMVANCGKAAPLVPTGLTATAGNAQVTLNWTFGEGSPTYNIYRSTSSGTETFLTHFINRPPFVDTGRTNGTKYFYKITAVNGTFESARSSEVSATPFTIPNPPTNLMATAGNAQVTLAWTASATATSYNVYRGASAGGEATSPVATGIATTSYTDTGRVNGTKYFYKAAAVSAAGTSGQSNEASATPVAGGACVTASLSSGFKNTTFTNQTGTFTAQFDATPSVSPIDSSVSLSKGAQTAYTGLATMVRFNPSGKIDARNGGGFSAAASIAYAAGKTYHFRVVVNIPTHTYSIFVTAPGGTEQTVGNGFAFRTEQNAVTSLNNWAVSVNSSSGSTTGCAFGIQ